jgi:hypothetical protein
VSQIKRLVDDFCAREDRSETWFARQVGVSSKTMNSWFTRGRKSLLPPRVIKSMSRVLGLPYRTVLEAALYDSGYLPEKSVSDIRNPQEPLHARTDDDSKGGGAVIVDESLAPLEQGPQEAPSRSPQRSDDP